MHESRNIITVFSCNECSEWHCQRMKSWGMGPDVANKRAPSVSPLSPCMPDPSVFKEKLCSLSPWLPLGPKPKPHACPAQRWCAGKPPRPVWSGLLPLDPACVSCSPSSPPSSWRSLTGLEPSRVLRVRVHLFRESSPAVCPDRPGSDSGGLVLFFWQHGWRLPLHCVFGYSSPRPFAGFLCPPSLCSLGYDRPPWSKVHPVRERASSVSFSDMSPTPGKGKTETHNRGTCQPPS